MASPSRRRTNARRRTSPGATRATPSRATRQQAVSRDERDFLSRVMETSPAGIVRLDRDGRITFANRRAEEVLGLTRSEIGRRTFDHPEWRITDYEGKPFPSEWLPFEIVRRTRETVADVRHAIELPGGRRVLLSVNAAPLFDGGTFDGVVATVEDVTERVLAEWRLREASLELDRFFSLALDLLCIADTAGRFVRLNKAWERVLGFALAELEGRHFLDFVHPEDRAATEQALARLASGQPALGFVNRYRHRDGSYRRIEWRSYPYQQRLIYAAARDVTERFDAVERLARSESRYRFFLESLQGIAYQIDTSSDQPVFVHGAVTEITGYDAADIAGGRVRWLDVVHPDDRARFAASTRRLNEERGGRADLEYRIVRKDGSLRWVRDIGQNAVEEDGSRSFVNGVLWDVTARRRMEESLRTEENRLRSIFRAAPVGIGVVSRRILVEVNERVCEMTGYAMQELVGQSARMLYPSEEEFDRVGREKYAQIEAAGIGTIETRWRTKDGRLLEVLMSSVPLEPKDLAAGVTFTALDISERKRAAEELARAQALLVAAIEQSPAGILIADAPGARVRLANPAALGLLGTDAAPLAGESAGRWERSWRVFHPDGRAIDDDALPLRRAVLGGETVRNEEQVVRRADGEERWVLANAAPVRDARGEVVAGVLLFSDITDLKRAEAERERLQAQVQHVQKLESLGVLAGGIAHDFNNMLMAILGNADLAQRSLSALSPARSYLAEIETASRRAADLCRQMLAYSGKGRFVVESLDLNEVVREMTRMLEVSISKAAVLKYNFGQNLPSVEADATQLRQVLMNLITNASEAIGERSGVISLTTGAMHCDRAYLDQTFRSDETREGTFVYFEVADTGCGMTPDVKARLFDPFFTTKFTGRGLGMAAALGIVRGHKGAIKIYSEPGKGTTIKVLLPASNRPLPSTIRTPDTGGEWQAAGTILVADDEETVRVVTEAMLSLMGFQVILAPDGEAALQVFRERRHEIRCVLLDLTMPHMDGEATYRELRRIDENVRVVMTSGYNEQEVTQRFVGKGLAGFVQKPFQFDALRDKLREVLEERPAASPARPFAAD